MPNLASKPPLLPKCLYLFIKPQLKYILFPLSKWQYFLSDFKAVSLCCLVYFVANDLLWCITHILGLSSKKSLNGEGKRWSELFKKNMSEIRLTVNTVKSRYLLCYSFMYVFQREAFNFNVWGSIYRNCSLSKEAVGVDCLEFNYVRLAQWTINLKGSVIKRPWPNFHYDSEFCSRRWEN